MVGHTGNINAAKQAIQCLDKEVKVLVDTILAKNGQALIIADHGNADRMKNRKTGEIMTSHTKNPVPCILIRENVDGIKMQDGILADVAPTLLKMMGVPKPVEMTGKELF